MTLDDEMGNLMKLELAAPNHRQALRLGKLFEEKMMDLSVNIPLEEALDLGWKILAECFDKTETGIKSDMIDEFWPENRN